MAIYSPQITLFLGVLLVMGTWLVYNYFKKLKLDIDKKFLISVIPWIVLIAIVRVLVDANVYPDIFITTTPGIALFFLAIMLPLFYITKKLEEKTGFEYWKSMIFFSMLLIIMHLPYLKIRNPEGGLMILGTWSIILTIMYFFSKLIKKIPELPFWAIATHFLDASATFVSIQFFGYGEKHFLPELLINMTGPWIMFVLKTIVIIPVLYIIWKYSEDKTLRNFLTIVVLVLGLAPGIRDTIRLVMAI